MFLVKPVEGRRVRHPSTAEVLGPDGVKVETIGTFWFRRLKDGDVTIAEIKGVKEKKSKPDKPEKDKDKDKEI